MTAADDMRILWDMADEINRYGVVQLGGALRSGVSTKRGQQIAFILERTARRLADANWNLKRLKESHEKQLNGLRDEMQRMTDALLESEKK